MQDYMKLASLEDSRLEFRYRVGMLDNRANMGKKYESRNVPTVFLAGSREWRSPVNTG